MSVKVSSWVWDDTTAKGSDRVILLALADWANDNGWSWYSADELAEKTRMGRATVFRRLDVLEECGLVERFRRGRTLTTVYRVAVPWADVRSYPLPDPPAEVKSQIETLVKSHSGQGEVSRVRPVKSHGRDIEPSVNVSNRQGGAPRRKPETTIPEGWKPTPRHGELATQYGLDLSSESFAFRAHAVANDRRMRDWDAAFSMWLSKSRQFARTQQASQPRSQWDRAERVRGDRA